MVGSRYGGVFFLSQRKKPNQPILTSQSVSQPPSPFVGLSMAKCMCVCVSGEDQKVIRPSSWKAIVLSFIVYMAIRNSENSETKKKT